MKEKFFNKKVDYFWEFEYPFGEVFLKEIFQDSYKRKYSMVGEGIFNLVFLEDKIYDISFKKTNSFMLNDGKFALRDKVKYYIVQKIVESLEKENVKYTVNSGKYITFEIQNNYIAKVEIVKKKKMHQNKNI